MDLGSGEPRRWMSQPLATMRAAQTPSEKGQPVAPSTSNSIETEGDRLRLVCECTQVAIEYSNGRWAGADKAALRAEPAVLGDLGGPAGRNVHQSWHEPSVRLLVLQSKNTPSALFAEVAVAHLPERDQPRTAP